MIKVLVTNDDGIDAAGLISLAEKLADHADRIFRMENGHLSLERDYIGGTKKTSQYGF